MTMKPFGKLMDRKEALNLIEKNIKQINRTEIIPLEKSIGRILATDIIANFNVPPFNRASMDGYAVIADDTQTATEKEPVKLKLIGILHAGKISSLAIKKGECMEISTGSINKFWIYGNIAAAFTTPILDTAIKRNIGVTHLTCMDNRR